jgi:hypothetical protein
MRLLFSFCLLVLGTIAAPAQTTRSALSQTDWTDVCAAPCSVATLSGIAALVVNPTQPATIDVPGISWTPENGLFPNPTAGSHVYARAISAGTSVASIPGTSGAGASSSPIASTMSTPMMFSRLQNSASGMNLTLAKSGSGRASTYQGCNTTPTTIYMRIYDVVSTDAVTPGTTPVAAGPYAFPGNNCATATNLAGNAGIMFTNGLVYAFGTSPDDDDATGIDAGALTAFQLGYQ